MIITSSKSLIILICVFSYTSFFGQRLKIGDRMPSFELMDQHSDYFNSDDYLNKKNLIVFFYTEDSEAISTREVIAFNEALAQFKALNTVVVAINPASIVYHRKFVIKLNINYPVLFDRNSDIQKRFKVPFYKKTKNPERYTFVIDKKGIIQRIFHNDDNAEIHVYEALNMAKLL